MPLGESKAEAKAFLVRRPDAEDSFGAIQGLITYDVDFYGRHTEWETLADELEAMLEIKGFTIDGERLSSIIPTDGMVIRVMYADYEDEVRQQLASGGLAFEMTLVEVPAVNMYWATPEPPAYGFSIMYTQDDIWKIESWISPSRR